mmetsp:Transcript_20574/g.62457  ORF Transcript_20574/g.62457 Transcript_20574/m.62457 type:complete len:83 (-) Transcript_20574:21-269(-)
MLCALTWVALFHGANLKTNLHALATDLNTIKLEKLFVDQLLFHLHFHILKLVPEMLFLHHGQKLISVLDKLHGGNKLCTLVL